MNHRLRHLTFTGFRGLPDYSFDTKGRNVLIVGGSGKGKSAIVDGIEFAFSGRLARFHGRGTGSIRDSDAIQHVSCAEEARVELDFMPANRTVSRKLGDTTALSTDHSSLQHFLDQHPSVQSFILRRAQLLRFLESEPQPRYEMLVGLLGLERLDGTQQAFTEARRESEDRANKADEHRKQLLTPFAEPEKGFKPKKSQEVLDNLGERAKGLGCGPPSDWDGLGGLLDQLQKELSEEVTGRLDKLTSALSALQTPVPSDCADLFRRFHQACANLTDMRTRDEDAARASVIGSGFDYMREHRDESTCPLCRQELPAGATALILELERRLKALTNFRSAKNERDSSLHGLHALAKELTRVLETDLRHTKLYSGESEAYLRKCLTNAQELRATAEILERTGAEACLLLTFDLAGVEQTRRRIAERLQQERAELVSGGLPEVQSLWSAAKVAFEKRRDLIDADRAVAEAEELRSLADATDRLFAEAREKALEEVMNEVAALVLRYYRRLHDFGPGDQPECTDLSLQPEGKSRRGGLELIVEFLERSKADPRTYLSEAHLDSLGLCIYLAFAKTFNSDGTLLVLDDVLTSIDRDHRDRVRELLLEEFSTYQLIVTTHDEQWARDFQDALVASGLQGDWVIRKFVRWSLASGPDTEKLEMTWKFIEENLTEPDFHQIGGALRCVFEDFLKRSSEALELRVRYSRGGRYTAGDFITAGLPKNLRKKLEASDDWSEEEVQQKMRRVFGTHVTSALSHEGERRLTTCLSETADFVSALKELTKMSREAGVLKGPLSV